MSLIENFKYRPEVDGLRAVAVLAVVFFHCGLGVPGGYVGVDVFFVISGYLITSLILKDLQLGRFSMLDFWERRARRILPASIVTFIVTAIAGWWLLLPFDYAAFGRSLASQAMFAGNIYFWRNTNYFAGPADEQPLLHTWSLAVEEQFYMVVPLLLLGLFQFRFLRRRVVLIAILSAGLVGSLLLSALLIERMPAATFYLLPTRAWELLSGSVIALVPVALISGRKWLQEFFSLSGLFCILLPCFLYTKETQFPGLAAIPPVIGSALLILGCSSKNGERMPLLGRLLALRPIVFIGLISYSLYLWHWPLVAFSHYWALEEFSLTYRCGLIVVSFILAVASWRYVETPFRVRKLGSNRKAMFVYSIVGLAGVIAIGVAMVAQRGFPTRFSERVLSFDAAKADALHENRITKKVTLADARSGDFPRLGAPSPAEVSVLVWGDSHARSILPAIDTIGAERGVGVLSAWHSSTPPLLNYEPSEIFNGFSLGSQTPAFSRAIVEYVKTHQIPQVLLVACWSVYFEEEARQGEDGALADALFETIGELRQAGCEPWLLMEVPNHRASVPQVLLHQELFGRDITTYQCSPQDRLSQIASMQALLPQLRAAGARVIDVAPALFDAQANRYVMDLNDVALYYDNHHLTQVGARLVAPVFAEAMFAPSSEGLRHGPVFPFYLPK